MAHIKPDPSPPHKQRNFYGRLKGKALSANKKRLLAEDLAPRSLAGVSYQDNPARTPIDLDKVSGGRPLWLEIGFGAGEHLIQQAIQNPTCFFIGAEPYINGIAALLGKMSQNNPDNIAIHAGDVRTLFDVLQKESLDGVFLLYPDPWPKKRHHRRRFVTQDHLTKLAPLMKKSAELRIVSDIGDYIRQALEEVPKAGFVWLGECAEDWRVPWQGWFPTRYEKKALKAGRKATYLRFQKI